MIIFLFGQLTFAKWCFLYLLVNFSSMNPGGAADTESHQDTTKPRAAWVLAQDKASTKNDHAWSDGYFKINMLFLSTEEAAMQM